MWGHEPYMPTVLTSLMFLCPAPEPSKDAALTRQLAAFTTIRWDGWATFNGLTLKVTRRFTRGLSFDAEYTLSKSMDDASDTGTTNAEYNLPQNAYDPALEKGPSSFDHRNRFTANAVYDLPFARGTHGLLHVVAGSWRASGILMLQSGAPFTVNLSSAADVANIGLVGGNNVERPNLVGDPNAGPKKPQQWFNTSAFSFPLHTLSEVQGETMSSDPDSKTLICHSRRSGSPVSTSRCNSASMPSTHSITRTSMFQAEFSARPTSA